MIDLASLNVDAVLRHYALANTPGYLFRQLRAEPSIATVAESSTTKELLDEISRREDKADSTAEDIAIAYALLVAISFKDYRSMSNELANWQPTRLAWARSIVSILTRPTIATSLAQFDAHNGRIVSSYATDPTPTDIKRIS